MSATSNNPSVAPPPSAATAKVYVDFGSPISNVIEFGKAPDFSRVYRIVYLDHVKNVALLMGIRRHTRESAIAHVNKVFRQQGYAAPEIVASIAGLYHTTE